MAVHLCHRLLSSTLCFFLPTLLLSQVIIREKVELQPRLTPRLSTAADSVLTYFDPPPLVMQDGFPTVTLTCRLEVRGAIDQDPSVLLPGEIANIVLLRGSQEYSVRSISRDPAGWGGSPHTTDTRFQGVWGKGGGVECRMYGFNSNVWFDAQREISLIQPDSSFGKPVGMFTFRAQFYRYQAPSIWITGRALAAADIVPEARLARWEVRSSKIQLSNDERAYIEFTSYDSAGAVYWPIRIPGAVAPVTVEVRAKGAYAYLEGANEEGKLIVQMLDWSGGYSPTQQVELVFDPRRGKVPNNRDTVTVVVTGGGKTDSVQVDLVYEPLDHFIEHLEKNELKYEEGTVVTVIAKDLNDEEAEIDSTRQVVIRATSGGTPGGGTAAKLTQKMQLGQAKVQRLMERPEAGSFAVDGGDTIPDEVTVPYSVARGGKVKYVPNGRVPLGAGPEPVTIRAEALDESWKYAEAVVMVKAEELCPVVEFARKRMGPGDTVRVTIKGKKPDGTAVEYRRERVFDISISKGAEFGLLRSISWDEMGTSFEERDQPFEFIAVDSLTVDSALVQITGYPSPSGGGEDEIPASIKVGRNKADQVVSFRKGSSEKKAARATALARLLSENACETPLDTLVVKASRFDHFVVRSELDTVAFTEATRLFVHAKEVNNSDIEVDGNALLTISIDNAQYGSFINASGDTVPSPHTDILYSDAKNGNIRFAAIKKNPDSVVTCQIRAALQGDATKKGDTTIVVVEQTLRIVMDKPYEVRPSIPTEDSDTAMVRLRRKSFEVRVTRARRPVANHPFRLRTDYVRESGGHDHSNTRATMRAEHNDNYGYFLSGQPERRYRPLDDLTEISGRFSVSYHSSIFGDTMKIYLQSRNCELLRDSISVVERVPGLELLPESPDYTQIGGTQEHHGPPLFTRRDENHNHFAAQAVNQNIEAIAAEYRRQFPNSPRFAINDISLPFGGKFDINGRWNGSHTYHRNGLDVDVRTGTMTGDFYTDVNRNGAFDPGVDMLMVDRNNNGQFDRGSLIEFRSIAAANGGMRVDLEDPEGQNEHWHLYFWSVR